jgi:gamma-glutamyltranspeptidase
LFSRYVYHDMPLDKAVASGRWLLGRTWGEESHSLKIENDLAQRIADGLAQRAHEVAIVEPRNELMGHAGAIVLSKDGIAIAASDPRSDGKAFCAPAPE